MTTMRAVARIKWSSDSNWRTIRREAYWITWLITNSFSINISPDLSPGIIFIFVDSYMTTIRSIATIIISTNSDNRTICRKTYWFTWMIIISFSINIRSYLRPSVIDILINTYMTTLRFISIITCSPNSNNRAIRGDTNRWTWFITTSFSSNITSHLSPGIIDILINTNKTTISSIPIITWRANNNNRTIRR